LSRENHAVSIRAILAGLAAGLLAAILYFLPGSPPPSPAPAAADGVAQTPDAPPLTPKLSVAEPAAARLPETVNFAEGFCSETGGESVTLHFTLEKLVSAQMLER